MADSGARRAGSLIEVARILVQQRRQYGAPDHDVRETIGSNGPNPLSISAPTLAIIWSIRGLSGRRNQADSGGGDRIGRDLKGELKFHFRCERRCITVV